MARINIPADLDAVLNEAWEETQNIPGHLVENETRFLGLLAACVPAKRHDCRDWQLQGTVYRDAG